MIVVVKNRFERADQRFRLEGLESERGEPLDVAAGSGHVVRVRLPLALPAEDVGYSMLMRHIG